MRSTGLHDWLLVGVERRGGRLVLRAAAFGALAGRFLAARVPSPEPRVPVFRPTRIAAHSTPRLPPRRRAACGARESPAGTRPRAPGPPRLRSSRLQGRPATSPTRERPRDGQDAFPGGAADGSSSMSTGTGISAPGSPGANAEGARAARPPGRTVWPTRRRCAASGRRVGRAERRRRHIGPGRHQRAGSTPRPA